jgi:hypothetical protein
MHATIGERCFRCGPSRGVILKTIQKTDPSSRLRGRLIKQNRNCQTLINMWSWAPDGARHQSYSLTVSHNVTLTLSLANPSGGGVEYLHRDPASRKRRRKGKSDNEYRGLLLPRVKWPEREAQLLESVPRIYIFLLYKYSMKDILIGLEDIN